MLDAAMVDKTVTVIECWTVRDHWIIWISCDTVFAALQLHLAASHTDDDDGAIVLDHGLHGLDEVVEEAGCG